MASFGQYLKRERETRGVSLREISDSTRISLRYLEALETDSLEIIPRQFFVRAIIRSYAKAVGLDENQVLGKFDNKLEFGEQLEYKASAVESAPARSGFPGWARALIVALVVITAGVLLYFLFLSPRRTGRPPAKTAPAAAAVEVVPTPVTPSPPPPLPQEPPAEQLSGLALEAAFAENTWLRVTADGRQVFEGIKRPGETLEVKAESELVLATGNAGGMTFKLNGRRARPLGPRGAVVTDIRMTPDNFITFLVPETAD
jgi:cytoskeletal protein RodZ